MFFSGSFSFFTLKLCGPIRSTHRVCQGMIFGVGFGGRSPCFLEFFLHNSQSGHASMTCCTVGRDPAQVQCWATVNSNRVSPGCIEQLWCHVHTHAVMLLGGKFFHPCQSFRTVHSVCELVWHLLAQLRIILEFLLQGLVFALSTRNLLVGEWEFIWEFVIVSF